MKIPLGDPVIRGRLHHAYPLSILSNHEDFPHWFYANYIQVAWQNHVIGKNHLELAIFDFYLNPARTVHSPLLDQNVMPMAELAAMEDPLLFVRDSLRQGYGVYLYADDYFIPGRFSYRKMHFVHDVMVYGYEETEDLFLIVGYNERLIYTKGKVPSPLLREAIRYATLEEGLMHNPFPEEFSQCTLFRAKAEARCRFDLSRIVAEVSDYLYAEQATERHTIGKQGAGKLGEYLEAAGKLKTLFDVRPFYLIWEHKKHVVEMLEYVEHQTGATHAWSKQLAPIEKTMLQNRNLAVKYSISRQKTLLQEMRDNFDRTEAAEVEVLEDFLNQCSSGLAIKPIKGGLGREA